MKKFKLKININPNQYYLVMRNPSYDSDKLDYVGYLYLKLPEGSVKEFGRIKIGKNFEISKNAPQTFESYYSYVESLINVYERALCYEGVFEFKTLISVKRALKKLNLIYKFRR